MRDYSPYRKNQQIASAIKVSIVLAALVYGQVTSAGWCQVESSADLNTGSEAILLPEQAKFLSNLEEQFFGCSYEVNEASIRLDRLEVFVFGTKNGGSSQDRMARLKPFYKEPVIHTQVQTQELQELGSKPVRAVPNEQDCAIQRAQVAVQAASEVEAKKLVEQGVVAWRAGKKADAQLLLEQAVATNPQDADAQYSLGIIEEANGSLFEALSSYNQALELRPDNLEYKNSIAEIEKKIQLANNPEQLKLLGDHAASLYKSGQYEKALAVYKQLDAALGGNALSKYNLGMIMYALKEPKKALDYFNKAHQFEPMNERYSKAVIAMEKVLSGDVQKPATKTSSQASKQPARVARQFFAQPLMGRP
jgi:tetratricopeptide (TPR) repeat protein